MKLNRFPNLRGPYTAHKTKQALMYWAVHLAIFWLTQEIGEVDWKWIILLEWFEKF